MPRDGNGKYSLPAGNPVQSGTTILAVWANDTMPDLGDAITDSLSRSGQGGMLAPFKLTDGGLTTPAIGFQTEPTLGFYRSATGVIGFVSQSSVTARILPSGQISVAAAAPANPDELTRKDFVEAQLAAVAFNKYLAGYADTGLHEVYLGDLNDINYNANYYIYANGVTNNPPIAEFNGPMNLSVHVRSDTNAVLQTVVGMNTPAQYMTAQRLYQGGTWGDWKLVVDGGAFTERLAGYDDDGEHAQYSGDLNAITYNSVFSFSNAINQPSDMVAGWGHVETMALAGTLGNYATQIVYGDSQNYNKVWIRNHNNGAWTPWKLVVDGGAFTQRLSGYLDTGQSQNYSGDLNDIGVNSMFSIDAGNVTNEPADMSVNGNIVTLKHYNALYGQQIIYGAFGADEGKQWQRPLDNGVWGAWKLAVDPAGGGGGDKPIGALEFGYDPNGILSGVWTQWPEGTFLMNTVGGADPSGGSNNAAVVSHTHTITHTHSIAHNHASATTSSSGNHSHAAAGNHAHTFAGYSGNNNSGGRPTTSSSSSFRGTGSTDAAGSHSHAAAGAHTHTLNLPNYTGDSGASSAPNTGSAGASGTNKNKPLYKGVAVWERTA